jgi:hypothetical protein
MVVLADFVFGGSNPALGIGARCGAAFAVALYHLLETASTQRHGEFPFLYNAFAMLIPDSRYASAVSMGIGIHFVISSGTCKMVIGGARSWCHPETMRTYLEVYGESKGAPPISKSLNRWLRNHDWATIAISVGTLLLECVAVPATLLLPPQHRWVTCLAMVCMHIGIAIVMSFPVGLAFFTVLPSYLVGFSSADLNCVVGAPQWYVALLVGLGPTLLLGVAGGGRLLPENWPSSAISLFMFSGSQAKALSGTMMTGDTRVVLATANTAAGSLLGLPVAHHGAVMQTAAGAAGEDGPETFMVHDAVLRVIAFTLVQGDLIGTLPLPSATIVGQAEAWDVGPFLERLQIFLVREQRLVERHTGRPLARAFLVRIDEKARVVKVLREAKKGR